MKRTVLLYGVVSGFVALTSMLIGIPAMLSGRVSWKWGEVAGYTSIVLAALVVFFGVRSYRERSGGGRLRFGCAFAVGVSIAAVSAACYSATWVVLCLTVPDFGHKVAVGLVDQERANGASPAKLAEAARRSEQYEKLWANPAINFALTFLEPFPIGLVAAMLSAAILRRKQLPPDGTATHGAVVVAS